MDYNAPRALELLRLGSGIPDAQFREDQEDAIRHVVEGRGKLLVVQKTGWGKSFVYFISTKLLRESGSGPALLISPLLSLMRNQIAAAERMGVIAETINSSNKDAWDNIVSQVLSDDVDILLVTPERLANEDFRQWFLGGIGERLGMLVVDEAHCISDWGHDFRPEYRLIERMSRNLPDNFRLLATTATANDRVMDDLASVLGPNVKIMQGDLSRPSLLLQTINLPSQAERLAWLAEQVAAISASGIIYTLTIRAAEQVTRWLQSQGLAVKAYTRNSENREQLEQELLDNRVKALVATSALGMGFDKPDLAFVIHYQTPGSVVHYYQQVGRAGRNLDAAYGVLLSGAEDTEITDYFIENAFPNRDEVNQVLDALASEPRGFSLPGLLGVVNLSQGRVDQIIDLLSLESPSPVTKQGPRWQLAPVRLGDAFWQRAERRAEVRHYEQRQMQEYVSLTAGHMEFLIRALDGNPEFIQQPDLSPLPTTPNPAKVLEALEFLRRTNLPIEPRKRWPAGGLPQLGLRGNIRETLQAETGRALCHWGDAGWSKLVQSGKYADNHFSDELVSAAVRCIKEQWNPYPAPNWVTCIPSRRHPDLVPDFARRLADALGLPFRAVLEKTGDRPEQKSMANSAHQARNLDGAIGILQNSVLTGPVILVDDMVDSGWTFTVAAALLRQSRCSTVFPFALADTGSRQG